MNLLKPRQSLSNPNKGDGPSGFQSQSTPLATSVSSAVLAKCLTIERRNSTHTGISMVRRFNQSVAPRYGKTVPGWLGRIFAWMAFDPYSPTLQNVDLIGPQELKKLPLVVFSHGNGSCRTTNSRACEEMASQGYLVAALEHLDGSACAARYVNGKGELQWKEFEPIGTREDYEVRNRQVSIRANECSEAVKMIKTLDFMYDDSVCHKPYDQANEFDLTSMKGRIDWDKGVALSGHSFGGGTIVKALKGDESFSNAFCFDAWLYPIKFELEELRQGPDKPLFFLNYQKFQWKNNLTYMSTFEKGGNIVTIKDAVHYTCNDLPVIFEGSYINKVMRILSFFTSFGRTSTSSSNEARKYHFEIRLFLLFTVNSFWMTQVILQCHTSQTEIQLSSNQGWELSMDLCNAWLRSSWQSTTDEAQLTQILEENRSHLLDGTKYLD